MPYVGWLLSLGFGFTLLMQWAEAELVDTIVILFVSVVLAALVALPFGIGMQLGFGLGFPI